MNIGLYLYFISNFFFFLPCDRVTVFKNYLIDNLKDFILLMWVNTYIYIFLSTLFFLEMYESITHNLIYLNFFLSDIHFSFTLIYIVCVGDFWLRFWCMYIAFL